MRIVVAGEAPPGDPVGAQLDLLLRGLHLRADVQVAVAWERGDTSGWRRYASQRLVVDDLRTWAPARWVAPAGAGAVGKVRGAELRRRLAPLRRPDVLLRVDGTGADLADRLGPARIEGVIATGALEDDDARRDVAVIMAGASVPARPGPTIVPVPRLVDGAWARAAGLRPERTNRRSRLGIISGPLVVGLGAGVDATSRFVEIVASLGPDADGTSATGLWLAADRPDGQVLAEGVRTATPSRELAALGDIVVVAGPSAEATSLVLDAVAAGARTIALEGAVPADVAQLVDLAPDIRSLVALVGDIAAGRPDDDRDDRMEQVRQAIDVVPFSARLAAALRAEKGEEVAA